MLKFFILILIVSATSSYNIPPYVHLCRRNDPQLDKCFLNTINELRPYMKNGIPEMNLSPIEPFRITEAIKFNSTKTSKNFMEMEIFESTLENASNYNVTKFAMDLNKGFYAAQVVITNVKLYSKYRVKGNLMVFNLDTEGDFICEVGELIANIELYASPYKKNDKEHFKFFYSNVTVVLNRVSLHFENVFKEKDLTANFNSVINKNIDILLPEFSPIVQEIVSKLSLEYLNDVYDIFPLDVLYPND